VENVFGKVHFEDLKGENGRIFARFSARGLLILAVACCSVTRELIKGKVHPRTGYKCREGE
jgi:hypothetical protein